MWRLARQGGRDAAAACQHWSRWNAGQAAALNTGLCSSASGAADAATSQVLPAASARLTAITVAALGSSSAAQARATPSGQQQLSSSGSAQQPGAAAVASAGADVTAAPSGLDRLRGQLAADGRSLAQFAPGGSGGARPTLMQATTWPQDGSPAGRRVYIETYGCQMNSSDTEVVLAVLARAGYERVGEPGAADVVLVNTCAIREGAEERVWSRLGLFRNLRAVRRREARERGESGSGAGPLIGVLGCMAERLKGALLARERLADLVVGPDAYRDLPRLLAALQDGDPAAAAGGAINVQLSQHETYADILPQRVPGATSAYLSIMRGCNNMCAFCIVPFTRGRERSRPAASILDEVKLLVDQGVKEVTLLGQNVNSYADFSAAPDRAALAADAADDPFAAYAPGFASVYKPRREGALRFAELLDLVAGVSPELRVRFTSPHPKDFADEVLQVIAQRPNVCKQLHMPAQSGSTTMLARMRRGYSREAYDALVARARSVIPFVALSTDMITGFCGETDEEHAASVDLMEETAYEQAFLFAYSQRARTAAARHLPDDVPEPVKAARLQQLIGAYRGHLAAVTAAEVGRRHLVLVEGPARRDPAMLTGRTCTNKRVMLPAAPAPASYCHHPYHAAAATGRSEWAHGAPLVGLAPGDYVAVEVESVSTQTLFARVLGRTTLAEFASQHGGTVVPAATRSAAMGDARKEPAARWGSGSVTAGGVHADALLQAVG